MNVTWWQKQNAHFFTCASYVNRDLIIPRARSKQSSAAILQPTVIIAVIMSSNTIICRGTAGGVFGIDFKKGVKTAEGGAFVSDGKGA